MGMTEKIKIVLIKKGITATQLAKEIGTSQSNLSKKMKRDNFSEKELEEIAEALGVKFEGFFIMDNGERI